MLCQEGETVVLSTFDLPQVLGAQQAGNNNTFVRSRRGLGLGNHSQESSRTPLLWVWQIKPPTVKGNSPTELRYQKHPGFIKKWFKCDLKGSLSPCLMLPVECINEAEVPGIFCAAPGCLFLTPHKIRDE